MADIRDGIHDIGTCIHNCTENGKIFNHKPYECTYYGRTPKILIQYKQIAVGNSPPPVWIQDDEADFDFISTLAKERERDLALGFRMGDDIKEFKNNHLEIA